MDDPFYHPSKMGVRVGVIIALLFVYLASLGGIPTVTAQDEAVTLINDLPEDWPTDAQSTTGPVPPQGISKGMLFAPQSQTILSGVPAYIWYHGCGPTAAGMVLGYWDGHGFDNLVPGNAATQTAEVNAMISSTGNYNDYCLPIDSYPNLLADRSEPPVGDEHVDNSVADFMKTSQSFLDNYYGWSWFSDMDNALVGYAHMVAPEYSVMAQNQSWGTFNWNSYRAEIDAGRPVVLLVDTDANGSTDHFVTAFGYSDEGGTNRYACRNTWDSDIHWFQFAQMGIGQSWGIYGATIFHITSNSLPAPTSLITNAVSQTQINLSWTDSSSDETAFHIERSPNGSTGWTEIDTVGAGVTTYQNTGLVCGSPYYYRVRAHRSSDNAYSDYSNISNNTTLPCGGTNWYVAKTGNDTYSCLSPATACLTIQAAIDKASNGETVRVDSGNYVENLILKPDISLLGAGSHLTTIAGHNLGGVQNGVIRGANGALVAGFTIANDGVATSYGYFPEAGANYQMTFRNNVFTGHYVGIHAGEGTPLVIYNNVFNNNSAGIVFGWANAPIIRNNIIVGNGGGIHWYGDGSPLADLNYNDVWNNSIDYDPPITPGTNDISADPLFVNSASGDYHLQSCSPAIDAGDPSFDYSNEPDPNGGRIDMGVFGNTSGATSYSCPPPNDDFDYPFVVNPLPYNMSQSTTGATTSLDDPVFTCTSGQRYNTVWYRYTPTADGVLTVNTFGSDYDTVLAVWTGARGALTGQACNDDSNSTFQSQVQVMAAAGTNYYIEVAGYHVDSYGTLNLAATSSSEQELIYIPMVLR